MCCLARDTATAQKKTSNLMLKRARDFRAIEELLDEAQLNIDALIVDKLAFNRYAGNWPEQGIGLTTFISDVSDGKQVILPETLVAIHELSEHYRFEDDSSIKKQSVRVLFSKQA